MKETVFRFITPRDCISKLLLKNMINSLPVGKEKFTVEVKRKYRPKFQWPLKHKDYGDESLK